VTISNRSDFKVAFICTLPVEADAVLDSLDEVWNDACHFYGHAAGDPNSYTFGRSGGDPVVVVNHQDLRTYLPRLRPSG
jgi:hypothetical protein